MFKERLYELINDKASYTNEDYYRLCRSIAKLFLDDEERSIKFILDEATDDDMFMLGEFFDEIFRLTIDDKMYRAFKKRYESMREDNPDAINKKMNVYENLHWSWV